MTVALQVREELLAELRCPATGEQLVEADGRLQTADGGRSYPIVDGKPILIDEERSLFCLADYVPHEHGTTPEPRAWGPWEVAERVSRLLPTDSRNVCAETNLRRLAGLLEGRTGRQRLLVVGGGTVGVGFEALLRQPDLEVVETDVFLGPRTQVVCDGHDLPFRDGSFDAVVCQAVLEHVADPPRVVAEIHRVLAPDGLVYSEIPFIQQVHEGALDFTRYTHTGHRRLFRHFDEIWSGAVCGPGMALAWSLRYFVIAALGRREGARLVVGRVVRVLTSWLLWFDGLLANRPGGLDGASATGFLGSRRGSPIPDREIVAGYRGAWPTPVRWLSEPGRPAGPAPPAEP
jgi:SAM-dependent methyltransferase